MRAFSGIGAALCTLLLAVEPVIRFHSEEWVALCALLPLAALLAVFRGVPVATTFGASVALLPAAGPQALYVVALCFLFISRRSISIAGIAWSAPAIAFLAGTAAAETVRAFAPFASQESFLTTLSVDSPERFFDAVVSFFEAQVPTWGLLSRFTIFALLVSVFTTEPDTRGAFFFGLIRGALAAALFALLYTAGLTQLHFQTQTAFWTSINRVSSTLSDPNALGLVMALCLWIAAIMPSTLPRGPRLAVMTCSILSAAGLVSGSRTFILLCALLVGVIAWQRSRRYASIACGAAAVFFVAVNGIDVSSPAALIHLQELPLPEGLKRLVFSATISRWPDAFFSRSAFSQISALIIETSPLFGIGADRYRDYVSYGATLGAVDIGTWVDNANNFYMGIVAELGITGSIIAVMTALARRFAPARPSRSVACVAALAVGLLTGPHTDFPEVLVIVSAVVGLTTVPRGGWNPRPIVRAASCFLLGALAAHFHESGAYRWKINEHGISRWLSQAASVSVPCPVSPGTAPVLRLKPSYIPSSGPLLIRVSSLWQSTTASATTREVLEIPVVCPAGRSTVRVRVQTGPAWSPYRATPSRSNDHRIFGLQQLSP